MIYLIALLINFLNITGRERIKKKVTTGKKQVFCYDAQSGKNKGSVSSRFVLSCVSTIISRHTMDNAKKQKAVHFFHTVFPAG
jgi:hypothetical protein